MHFVQQGDISIHVSIFDYLNLNVVNLAFSAPKYGAKKRKNALIKHAFSFFNARRVYVRGGHGETANCSPSPPPSLCHNIDRRASVSKCRLRTTAGELVTVPHLHFDGNGAAHSVHVSPSEVVAPAHSAWAPGAGGWPVGHSHSDEIGTTESVHACPRPRS